MNDSLAEIPTSTPSRRRRFPARLLAFGATLLSMCVLLEGVVRLAGPNFGVDHDRMEKLRHFIDGRGSASYVPRPYYGHARSPGASGNRWGFLGPDWPLERTPGVPRIVCLGGSTTESGNETGYRGSYPFILQHLIESRTGVRCEVMNCGISLWTSNETVAAWFLLLKDFQPDLVIFHHAANDVEPRNYPGFRPDYLHYRKVWDDPDYGAISRALIRWSDTYAWFTVRRSTPTLRSLTVYPPPRRGVMAEKGILPAETALAFARNILSIAADERGAGGEMMLLTMPVRPAGEGGPPAGERSHRYGIQEHNEIMRSLSGEHGFLLADAEAEFAKHEALTTPHFADLVHLDAEGNGLKAEVVLQELMRSWSGILAVPGTGAGPRKGS